MFIWGTKTRLIREIDVRDTICTHCGEEDSQFISVTGRYVYIYWVPMFPLNKIVKVKCMDCLGTLTEKEFTQELKRKYKLEKQRIRNPLWFWTGLLLILLVVTLIVSNLKFEENDLRKKALNSDLAQMTNHPSMESDSISFKLKTFLDEVVIKELKPERFKYYSRIKSGKALILVQIPDLKQVENEERKKIIAFIEIVLDEQKDLENKEIYIGVKGGIFMMMVKTPETFKNFSIVDENLLCDFYGIDLEIEKQVQEDVKIKIPQSDCLPIPGGSLVSNVQIEDYTTISRKKIKVMLEFDTLKDSLKTHHSIALTYIKKNETFHLKAIDNCRILE